SLVKGPPQLFQLPLCALPLAAPLAGTGFAAIFTRSKRRAIRSPFAVAAPDTVWAFARPEPSRWRQKANLIARFSAFITPAPQSDSLPTTSHGSNGRALTFNC